MVGCFLIVSGAGGGGIDTNLKGVQFWGFKGGGGGELLNQLISTLQYSAQFNVLQE